MTGFMLTLQFILKNNTEPQYADLYVIRHFLLELHRMLYIEYVVIFSSQHDMCEEVVLCNLTMEN